MEPHFYRAYDRLEADHWWFRARRRILRHVLGVTLRPGPARRPRVCDVGCGCGRLMGDLRADHDVCGVDGSDEALAFCRARGLDVRKGSLPGDLGLPDASFDAVLLADVLEHVDDEEAALSRAVRLLRPGGALLVTVPAHGWLWSPWDEVNHHRRRYAKASLLAVLRSGPLHVTCLSWYCAAPFPLVVTSRLANRVLGRTDSRDEFAVPPAPVNALLEEVFAAERYAVLSPGLPFGLSLLALAVKVG
jgi:SAM-dependent methyltransferase